jgi:hypothetical protein
MAYQRTYGGGGGQPWGDAYTVQTPEIDQARNMLWEASQRRQAMQFQQMNQMDTLMNREFMRVRGADAPDIYDSYNQYKALRKQMLFDPDMRDPKKFAEVQQQANQALADTYQKIDDSAQMKQQLAGYGTAFRTKPNLFSLDAGKMYTEAMGTPTSQLSKSKWGDLGDLNTYRFVDNVDFNKLDKTAQGTPGIRFTESNVSPTDPLSNINQGYKYGNNPQQYKESFYRQLAALPNGEHAAANAMEHFTPEMIQQINQAYYADNPQKWNRTTGQDKPMHVEPDNPNDAAEQYASLATKIHWLQSEASQEKPQTVPNRAAIKTNQQNFQDKELTKRLGWQQHMANVRQGQWEDRQNIRNDQSLKDERSKNDFVNQNFSDEYNAAKQGQADNINGQNVYQVETGPTVKTALAKQDATGHKVLPDNVYVTDDGKKYIGVFTDAKGNVVTTSEESTDNLKPAYRKYVFGTQKKATQPTAPPSNGLKEVPGLFPNK